MKLDTKLLRSIIHKHVDKVFLEYEKTVNEREFAYWAIKEYCKEHHNEYSVLAGFSKDVDTENDEYIIELDNAMFVVELRKENYTFSLDDLFTRDTHAEIINKKEIKKIKNKLKGEAFKYYKKQQEEAYDELTNLFE